MAACSTLPGTAETRGTRDLMKIFLDAWYPGSPAQIALETNRDEEDWCNQTSVLEIVLTRIIVIWDNI